MEIVYKDKLSTVDGRNRNQVSRKIDGVKFDENEFPHVSMFNKNLFNEFPELKDFCGTSKDPNLAKLFMSVITDCKKKNNVEGIENLFCRYMDIDSMTAQPGMVVGMNEGLALAAGLYSRYFAHIDNFSIRNLHNVLTATKAPRSGDRTAYYTTVASIVYEAVESSRKNPNLSWFSHCTEAQKAWNEVSQTQTLIPLPYALNTIHIASEFSEANDKKTGKRNSNLSEYKLGLRFPYNDIKSIVHAGLKINDISRAYDAGFRTVEEITELTEMPYEWVDALLTPAV